MENNIIKLIDAGHMDEAIAKAPPALRDSMLAIVKDTDAFKTHYAADNGRKPGQQITENWGADVRQWAAFEQLRKLNGNVLLDIGCADGSFCQLCLTNNVVRNVIGVDLWKNGIEWAKNNIKGDFHFGMFEELTILPDYDVVHIGEVLEHVIDPVEVLAKVYHPQLKGIVVTVPIKAPPMGEEEALNVLNGKPLEHVRIITKDLLTTYAHKTRYRIANSREVTMGWVNLVATLIPL